MELIGKIIAVLPERSGVSARNGNEWKLASYVLETVSDRFPRKMMFEVFGSEKIQQFNIQSGEMVRVSFDIDAHEYNGRWFNSIRAWNVDRNLEAAPAPMAAPSVAPFDAAPAAAPMPTSAPAEAPFTPTESNEDLPF
ncbi:MAG: DUF3127 domain-containing protein [Bacteroidaceae bacterium]|nr:DUF3127 domain-containing protein [Bacteroidaceae bacterium]